MTETAETQIELSGALAEDVFPIWEQQVESAKRSIEIYTPYLDECINILLSQASIKKIRIITRIDGDSFFESGYQISALINAKRKGYSLFHLDGLHAKILVIDGRLQYIGSQNFTFKGRVNKEASVTDNNLLNTNFVVEKLNEWNRELVPISLELLNKLLKWQKNNQSKIVSLKEQFTNELSELIEEHSEEETQHELIQTLINNSSIRLAKEFANLERRFIGSPHFYSSLFADKTDDLISWVKRDKYSEISTYKLEWLHFYPAFNVETNQLAFLRLAQTRITYVRREVNFTEQYTVANTAFDVSLFLPKTNTKISNLRVHLKAKTGKQIILWYHFNGSRFKLKKKKVDESLNSREFETDFLKSAKVQDDFFSKHFRPFRYAKQLNFNDRGITEFAKKYRHTLTIIEFHDAPILVLN